MLTGIAVWIGLNVALAAWRIYLTSPVGMVAIPIDARVVSVHVLRRS